MILKPIQLIDVMLSAGWVFGQGLIEGYAICVAESSKDTAAKFVNTDGTIDRGLWMFNSKWHPEVSDACAYDATGACSSKEALRVYKASGPAQWSVYNNGRFRYFLEEGRVAYEAWQLQQNNAALKATLSSTQDKLGAALDDLTTCQSKLAADEKIITDLGGQLAAAETKISAAKTALA